MANKIYDRVETLLNESVNDIFCKLNDEYNIDWKDEYCSITDELNLQSCKEELAEIITKIISNQMGVA